MGGGCGQRDQLAERIEQMQQSLTRLNEKISRYEQGLMSAEHRLKQLEEKRQETL